MYLLFVSCVMGENTASKCVLLFRDLAKQFPRRGELIGSFIIKQINEFVQPAHQTLCTAAAAPISHARDMKSRTSPGEAASARARAFVRAFVCIRKANAARCRALI